MGVAERILYFEDEPPPGRRVFVGYALTAKERAQYGTHGLLRWACLQTLALGSDGGVYVEQNAIDAERRKVFRGYALTDEEAGRAFREFHRMAFNLTVAARRTKYMLGPRDIPIPIWRFEELLARRGATGLALTVGQA